MENSTTAENLHKTNLPDISKAALQQAENYLSKRYDFRRNIIIEKTEFKLKGETQYRVMRERDYNSLYRQLQKAEIKVSTSVLFSLLNSDYVEVYNPFLEYFDGLPAWDGTTDYIQQLAGTVKTTDDLFWFDCFKRWLVAMVGCATRDDITNHTVIVFTGEQGLGKTTWHMNLVPPQLRYYRFSGTVKPGNRDSIVHMAECLLINLDELESLNKAELGDLKEMITKGHIRLRRAYHRTVENYTRRASFCGSVNKSQFLTDVTGSRRFLCFEVNSIDYLQPINYDMVYAQALHLLKNGFQYWFNDAEIATITEKNERYQVITAEEDLLMKYFTPADDGVFFTPTRLAEILTARAKTGLSNSFIQNLGKALQKHQFKHVKQGGVYGYLAKEIKH